MRTNYLRVDAVSKLFTISAPLMLSFMSMVCMMFADRIFLANYSLNALSAVVSAGMVAYALTFGLQSLTLIGGVFVAQYNGAKEYDKIGAPVWQMLWFSVFTYIVFIPCLFLAGNVFFTEGIIAQEQALVFRCTMLISPLFSMVASLQGFYSGREKTMVITWLSVLGNLVNIILDPILIFGIDGFIPSLGIIGANIATALGLIAQIVIFGYLFLKKEHHEKYNTRDWRFKKDLFLECLRIGTPEAIAVGTEILAWGLFYIMMEKLGSVHILVTSVAQSITILFIYFGLGLEHGSSAMAGNLIGAHRYSEIKQVFYAGSQLTLIHTLFLCVIFKLWPDGLINVFFSAHDTMHGSTSHLDASSIREAKEILHHSIIWIAIYLGFEALRWNINGILRAAGDTMFLLFAGTLTIIFLMIIPAYVLIAVFKQPIEIFFGIWIFFAVCSGMVSFIRLQFGNWHKLDLAKE